MIGDLLFVSAEYGPGAGVLKVDGSTLTELWMSDESLSNHYATSVYSDEHRVVPVDKQTVRQVERVFAAVVDHVAGAIEYDIGMLRARVDVDAVL